MIVVDTNVLVAAQVQGMHSENARKLAELYPVWHVPPLWRTEFSNVLLKLYRAKKMTREEVDLAFAKALKAYQSLEVQVDDGQAVMLGLESGLSAYDAVFLQLARQLGLRLVTMDVPLITKSAGRAVSLEASLRA